MFWILLFAFPQEDVPARTIKWTTASEQDNFGFDVYRGESEDGPFTKLTEKPIQGAINSSEPHKYAYRDETIDVDKAYYYYVESISLAGVREKFTPVIYVPPYSEKNKKKDG